MGFIFEEKLSGESNKAVTIFQMQLAAKKLNWNVERTGHNGRIFMVAELDQLGNSREKLAHFLGWKHDSSMPFNYLNTNNFTTENSIAANLANL